MINDNIESRPGPIIICVILTQYQYFILKYHDFRQYRNTTTPLGEKNHGFLRDTNAGLWVEFQEFVRSPPPQPSSPHRPLYNAAVLAQKMRKYNISFI